MKTYTNKKAISKAKPPAKVKKAAPTKGKKVTSTKAKASPAKAKKVAPAKAKAAKKSVIKVASATSKKRITFTYRSEKGSTIFLAGSFNNWSATAKKMADKKGNGVYTAMLTLAPGSYEYKFVIDGTWCADPKCADWIQNEHGTLNSVKHVTA